MRILESIRKEEIRDLLGKGWLTHDGAWFYETTRELGIEKANKLNRAVISTMAPIEAKRLCEILGIEGKVRGFGEVEQLLRRGMGLFCHILFSANSTIVFLQRMSCTGSGTRGNVLLTRAWVGWGYWTTTSAG